MAEPTQASEAQPRWSIWIDIEGFSALWNTERAAVRALGHLMEGILQIGEAVFPGDSERLWAHQFGDGFVIVSEFHEPDLERCAAIAVSLMRQVARAGFMARAAIAEGEYADVAGLWPRSIREAQERAGSSSSIGLGSGVMTLLSTMGTALIRAKKLDETCLARGSVVAVATDCADRVPPGFPRRPVDGQPDVTTLDWVHAVSPMIDRIAAAGTGTTDIEATETAVAAYLERHVLKDLWKNGTRRANGM